MDSPRPTIYIFDPQPGITEQEQNFCLAFIGNTPVILDITPIPKVLQKHFKIK
jgi:hypothetical protein